MTGLDLSAVERVILSWAIDELRIDRDNGVADDQLDPDTLLLIPNEGERVWTGKGALQPLTAFLDQGDPDVVRIVAETGARYRALLPLREPTGARVGDVLTVDAVRSPSGDPRLAGRSFVVVHTGDPSSFSVASIVYLRPVVENAPDVAPPPPGQTAWTAQLDDPSTFTDAYGLATWTGDRLVGATMILTFPDGGYVDPAQTYTVEIDYEQDGNPYGFHASVHCTPDERLEGSYETLAQIDDPTVGATGTATLTIGPGILAWDEFVVGAGERMLAFQLYSLNLIALRVTPPPLVQG